MRLDHNIGQAERHSELPRPNGWCPFSGTLWTHESTQVLWCSWVLGKGVHRGRSPWNSVKKSGLITILRKLNAIVNCRVPMADVHFRVPYGLMSPHRYFGVPESQGKGAQRRQSPWNSVTRSGCITILGKLNAIVNCRVPMADVHFRVPYGLMSQHRYFVVPGS